MVLKVKSSFLLLFNMSSTMILWAIAARRDNNCITLL
jgi:hypothetical protein